MINSQIKIDDEVAVFAVKAPEILTSQRAAVPDKDKLLLWLNALK